MRIAVYTIAKNEVDRVDRFMDACADADIVIVGDTGSTDGTGDKLQQRGAIVVPVHISPWRFDVARNTVLALVPQQFDLCFSLDLDEYQRPGWRDLIEPRWDSDIHTRLWFKYVHSFNAAGAPATVGMKNFAHSRNGYMWKHRVHEDLYWQHTSHKESVLTLPELIVEHHQQIKTDRSAYVELLKEECVSETVTSRHVFWLCRELRGLKEWRSLVATCQKFLSYKDNWYIEKSHCHCMYAEALVNLKKPIEAITQYMAACEAAPKEREPWFNLGKHFYNKQQWGQAYGMFLQCIQLVNRGEHYLTNDTAWGHWPHYMAALCMFKLQSYSRALLHAADALKYNDDAGHIRDLIQLINNTTQISVNTQT